MKHNLKLKLRRLRPQVSIRIFNSLASYILVLALTCTISLWKFGKWSVVPLLLFSTRIPFGRRYHSFGNQIVICVDVSWWQHIEVSHLLFENSNSSINVKTENVRCYAIFIAISYPLYFQDCIDNEIILLLYEHAISISTNIIYVLCQTLLLYRQQ